MFLQDKILNCKIYNWKKYWESVDMYRNNYN